jgi:hypothetical protein
MSTIITNCHTNTNIENKYYMLNRISIREYFKNYNHIVVITNYDYANKLKNINHDVVVYIDIDDMCFSKDILDNIIRNRFVKHIYSTNLNYNHPSITFVPLGLGLWGFDFTKVCVNKNNDISNLINNQNDEFFNKTICLLSKNKKLNYKDRKKVIFMDWYNGNENTFDCPTKKRVYLERSKYYNQFKSKESEFIANGYSFYTSDHRVDVNTLWDTLSDGIFVISPPGNGYDCHRTYENLALGNVPILLRNKDICDNGFFERVGCIVVDNYSQITPDFLDSYIDTHTYDPEIKEELLLRYWFHKIKNCQ